LELPASRRRAGARTWEGRMMRAFDRLAEPAWRYLPPIVGVPALLFLAAPVLVAIPLSLGSSAYLQFPPTQLTLHWYQSYLTSRDWMDATMHSFEIAIGAVVLSTLIAIPTS